MSEITIRPLAFEDYAAWKKLFVAYLAFYETSRSPEQMAVIFTRLLSDDPDDFSGFVAKHEGQLIGFTHYLFHLKLWDDAPNCYLQDLYVAPAARGHGAGEALINAVHEAAHAVEAMEVYWLTQRSNSTARKLYDRVANETPFIKYSKPC